LGLVGRAQPQLTETGRCRGSVAYTSPLKEEGQEQPYARQNPSKEGEERGPNVRSFTQGIKGTLQLFRAFKELVVLSSVFIYGIILIGTGGGPPMPTPRLGSSGKRKR
jgi:hypothetical protein